MKPNNFTRKFDRQDNYSSGHLRFGGKLTVISHKLHGRLNDGRFTVVGGFATLKHEFARHVNEMRLCVPVQPSKDPSTVVEYPPNLSVVPLPLYHNRIELLIKLPRVIAILWHEVGNADLIYSMGPNDMGILGLIIARVRRRPTFLSIDTDRSANIEATESGFIAWMKVAGLRLIVYPILRHLALPCPTYVTGNLFLGNSSNWRQWIKSTDRSSDLPPLRSMGNFNEPLRIVFVGRVVATKNIDCLLEAAAILVLKKRPVEMTIIGEGPETKRLKERCHRENWSFVRFAGYLPNCELKKTRFLGADVLVLPSFAERQGKVLLEAMGCSVPVIASRVGGIPSVIQDGETGLLFNPLSPEELAQALLRLSDDTALRMRLVKNGYKFAVNNTLDKGVDKIMREVINYYELPFNDSSIR